MQRNHCFLDNFAEQFDKEIKTKKIQNIDTDMNTNTGIVPMFAEQLFKEIETKKAAGGIEFEVKLSMLEIYNEVITQEYVIVVLCVVVSVIVVKLGMLEIYNEMIT